MDKIVAFTEHIKYIHFHYTKWLLVLSLMAARGGFGHRNGRFNLISNKEPHERHTHHQTSEEQACAWRGVLVLIPEDAEGCRASRHVRDRSDVMKKRKRRKRPLFFKVTRAHSRGEWDAWHQGMM